MTIKGKKLVVFNWKMNPDTLKRAIFLAKTSDSKNVVVAPPFLFTEEVGKILKKAELGAQDLSWEGGGAFTGEVSAKELKNIRVRYVIVGHSERRKYLGETDEIINKKIKAALRERLKVILCVGENLTVRRRGKKAVEKFIKNQLQKDLKGISKSLIIAYEPIWAIGIGYSDTPKDAIEMIKYIKSVLNSKFKILRPRRISLRLKNSKLLYGGSVSGKNIKNFVRYKEIGGFLIGHASLKSKEVEKIIKTSSR